MVRKILTSIILTATLFLGEYAMAENALTTKQKSIATVASYAARGNQASLKQALAAGLDNGITVNEFKEILVQAYAYCGFPRSLNALNTLMQVVEERNNKDEEGKQPNAKPAGNSLEYGTENQTKLVGKPVEGKLFEFAPAIDEYLKAHLFGDIFARDNVDWQTRELATVAMLASLNGVSSQLNSHINIGKHNGLTDEQINEILEIADKTGAENVLFGFGTENTAYAQYFIGKSYLQPLTKDGISAANVTFEPKCRNNWHIHHKTGQTLFVISGRGWYQEWGKPAQELKAGDVVNIPEGVKHWHGAAKDSWFTHIAISIPNEGATSEWLEAVSDEEYNKLK
ncbi:MAG: carboxymuconolactone decarboxylase family protein [Acetobacter sp.]|nr:carboxymuconolactone decarboxylase family protein [Acetobacter sp.]